MAYITPSSLNIKTCFQYYYSLPYFQRDYKWEFKHFSELFNDIQEAFVQNFDPSHGRRNVSDYTPYFLGSIITSGEVDGKRPLIDGQQRLTSVFIILAFLERYKIENNVTDTVDLSTLLYSINYGSADYKIDFSDTRKILFDAYLKTSTKSSSQALRDAEDLDGLDDSDKRILEMLRGLDQLFDNNVKNNIKFFIDYFIEKVQLIEIAVVDEAEAHRVFVTMNDRGLRLGPIELLKGKILSAISNTNDTQVGHAAWIKITTQLQNLGNEEDSLFFRQFLRARYANTIRGKAKGAQAGDFDLINDGYHRWFEAHLGKVGLNTSDDFLNFTTTVLPFYVFVYEFIKRAEDALTQDFEYLYYNAIRKYSFQSMVLLAVVEPGDSEAEWKRKIVLVAKFIDVILTSRTIDGKENNYDNLKQDAFDLMKAIRGKNYVDLISYVHNEWHKYSAHLNNFSNITYSYNDRADVLYLLARLACYLEESLSITNKVGFITYLQRDRKMRTFDIEHLLKESFDPSALPASHGFIDTKDYSVSRNRISALIPLPRSRNRSLQDKPYREKLNAYATENILAQSLTSELYVNNPVVRKYIAANTHIGLAPISDFGKTELSARSNMYNSIAKEIWGRP